jgi:hypothetical protein
MRRFAFEDAFDELARGAAAARRRLREHRAQPSDADGRAIEDGIERIDLRAGQDVVALDKSHPAQVVAAPWRFQLGQVKPTVRRARQAVMPDFVGGIQNSVEDRAAISEDKFCHRAGAIVWQFFKRPDVSPGLTGP